MRPGTCRGARPSSSDRACYASASACAASSTASSRRRKRSSSAPPSDRCSSQAKRRPLSRRGFGMCLRARRSLARRWRARRRYSRSGSASRVFAFTGATPSPGPARLRGHGRPSRPPGGCARSTETPTRTRCLCTRASFTCACHAGRRRQTRRGPGTRARRPSRRAAGSAGATRAPRSVGLSGSRPVHSRLGAASPQDAARARRPRRRDGHRG
jgi:hypothetical protein